MEVSHSFDTLTSPHHHSSDHQGYFHQRSCDHDQDDDEILESLPPPPNCVVAVTGDYKLKAEKLKSCE